MTEQPHKPGTSHDAPVTAAGRALLEALPQDWHPMNYEFLTDHILAIEAEARQASLTAPQTRESAPLDVERLREVLPQALSDAEPSMSDAADWEGSEYVYNLAEAIAVAYTAAHALSEAGATGSADPVATTDEDSEPIGPVRFTSANCRAGDHEYCASMVEQDVPELGITDCLCECHRAAATTDEEGAG